VVGGRLASDMIYVVVGPEAALASTFGETLEGPLAELIVRNWGVLITLVGAMLIYGAVDPQQRPLVLVVAGISKAAFIALVLSEGQRYLSHQAGIAIVIDLLMIGLFSWYLLATTITRRK